MKSFTGFSGAATGTAPVVPVTNTTPFTNTTWSKSSLQANLMNVYTGGGSTYIPFVKAVPTVTTTTGGNSVSQSLPETMAYIQRFHEAPIRALSSVGQTRVWNLLIDVIAQTGRFPNAPTVTSLQNFSVEGERRYWVHVAIDRLTGKILDEQTEVVEE
jgi:hypothetical protein